MDNKSDPLTNTADDNIADETIDELVAEVEGGEVAAAVADASQDDAANDAADEYMKRFEAVEARNRKLDTIISSLGHQPDQDHRFAVVRDYIVELQKMNNEMFDLLVEMNNFFAPK